MWKVILMLLLDILLFQWLRILIGGALRFLWHPSKTTAWKDDKLSPCPPTDSATWIAELKSKLDFTSQEYAVMGDSGKFYPLCVAASGYAEAFINQLRNFWTLDPVPRFRRSLDPRDDDNAFSIDQLSGMLYAIASLLKRNLLTDADKARLTEIFNYLTFYGTPFCCPDSSGKKAFAGRGQIYRPYNILSSRPQAVFETWCRVAYEVSGDRRYLLLHWLSKIFLVFSSLLATSDGSFWIGRIYGKSNHQVHSTALIAAAGYQLNDSWFCKRILKELKKRYWNTNADMLALYGVHVAALSQKEKMHLIRMVYSAFLKGQTQRDYTGKTKRFLSLIWPPELVDRFTEQLPPTVTYPDYTWERSTIKIAGSYPAVKRDWQYLDSLFPLSLYEQLK